jgi:hypothetical protein
MTGLGNLVDRTAPWLFEVGSWVFGGLTALNLVIMAALITVGPADTAIRISNCCVRVCAPAQCGGDLSAQADERHARQSSRRCCPRSLPVCRFPQDRIVFPSCRTETIVAAAKGACGASLFSRDGGTQHGVDDNGDRFRAVAQDREVREAWVAEFTTALQPNDMGTSCGFPHGRGRGPCPRRLSCPDVGSPLKDQGDL